MRKPDIRYWVLWLFLLGILVIVFLQVVSGYNITRLLDGNRQLASEMQVQYSLRKLQSDVIALESDIRGAVISGDKNELRGVAAKLEQIRLYNVHQSYLSGAVEQEARQLDSLVQKKIKFSEQIFAAFPG